MGISERNHSEKSKGIKSKDFNRYNGIVNSGKWHWTINKRKVRSWLLGLDGVFYDSQNGINEFRRSN